MAPALAPFFEEYAGIVFDPSARQKHHTLIRKRTPQCWNVHQVLVDPAGDNLWNLEVDPGSDASDPEPLLRLRRIGT